MSDYLTVEKTIYKKLSKAALEILAIIAYHQPITRAELEDIRGVGVSQGSLDILFESNWVEPRGHKNVPGKPSTWRTTRNFLDHFGLESIKDLPGISELKASGLLSRNIGPSVLNRDNINDI
jgi:segregation and condensation protein B